MIVTRVAGSAFRCSSFLAKPSFPAELASKRSVGGFGRYHFCLTRSMTRWPLLRGASGHQPLTECGAHLAGEALTTSVRLRGHSHESFALSFPL